MVNLQTSGYPEPPPSPQLIGGKSNGTAIRHPTDIDSDELVSAWWQPEGSNRVVELTGTRRRPARTSRTQLAFTSDTRACLFFWREKGVRRYLDLQKQYSQ